MKKVIITGANGYLGNVIVERLTKRGVECIKLVRNPQDANSYTYELRSPIENEAMFSGADYLIHLAHDFSANKSMADSQKINVEGSIRLFEVAIKHNIKTIFISSIGSFENCVSNYGKTKFLIEQKLQQYNKENYIIRPGLVYGAKVGGITKALHKLTKLPIVPIVSIKNNFHIVNYTDILSLIDSIVAEQQRHNSNKPIVAASFQPYSLRQMLKLMNAKILMPVPWQMVWFFIKAMETVGYTPRMGSDGLINLINQVAKPDFSSTITSNIVFTEFDTALTVKWEQGI